MPKEQFRSNLRSSRHGGPPNCLGLVIDWLPDWLHGCSLPLALLLLAPQAAAYPNVTIKSCWDGDSCRTSTGEKIRLACIDAPELTGPRAEPGPAKAARDHLRRMVVGQQVEIRRISKDRYGRTVGELFLAGPHITRRNVQREMVASGHAVVMPQYAKPCPWAR